MPVHLFLKCILSLFFFLFLLFFFGGGGFLIAPISFSGILEHCVCVCPVTWGNKDMTYVSVLIYRSDVK